MPQNYQGHHKQGESEKLSQAGGVYGDVITKCNTVFWILKKDNR